MTIEERLQALEIKLSNKTYKGLDVPENDYVVSLSGKSFKDVKTALSDVKSESKIDTLTRLILELDAKVDILLELIK